MHIVRDADRARDVWRDGVETRMYVSAATGSQQLTVFEQWCSAGHGAPPHLHAVEEVLRVLAGQADVWVGGEHARLKSGTTVIIPAGVDHSFTNTGQDVLHVQAILAAPIFEAHYCEPARDVRRWGRER
jgi:mannose-6-phosphate isomerase-like protein (cupin superfamily)